MGGPVGGPAVTEQPCRLRGLGGSLHDPYGVPYTSTKPALPGRWLNCRKNALGVALLTTHHFDTL